MDIAAAVREAISHHTMDSARSAQSAAHLIGPSEIGGCRQFLTFMVLETPYDPPADIKYPAFIGTAIGDLLEYAIVDQYPGEAQSQVPLTATLPSGRMISGTCDLLWDGVKDVKSVDGLELVRRTGASFRHRAQVNTYQLAAIQAGKVKADSIAALIYVDRSGRDDIPYVESWVYDPDITAQIEERLDDVEYHAMHDPTGAPRDEPYPWCALACPFFSRCRGADEHVSGGLIEDEGTLSAVKAYVEGKALEKQGAALADEAKQQLRGAEGSTGEYAVTWTDVPATDVPTYVRAAYRRLDVRPIGARKRKKK